MLVGARLGIRQHLVELKSRVVCRDLGDTRVAPASPIVHALGPNAVDNDDVVHCYRRHPMIQRGFRFPSMACGGNRVDKMKCVLTLIIFSPNSLTTIRRPCYKVQGLG
jgi:hypothetical protein